LKKAVILSRDDSWSQTVRGQCIVHGQQSIEIWHKIPRN